MKRITCALAALACALWAVEASAANPYRDRHFTHYALHDLNDLQDFHRRSYAVEAPVTWWSDRSTLEEVTPVPPYGELPPVPMPPQYEHRRRDYEYYRWIMPASVPPYPLRRTDLDTSPSDRPIRLETPPPAGTPSSYNNSR